VHEPSDRNTAPALRGAGAPSDPDTAPALRSGGAVRRIALAWLPAFSYMALIWTVSSMSVAVPLNSIPFKDKGVHTVEYGALAVLSAYAIRKSWPQHWWLRALLYAALLTFAWGYLDEVHQAFVPGRNSDAFDLLADSIGTLVGCASFGLFDRWRAAVGARG
jgi:VanZ family protein